MSREVPSVVPIPSGCSLRAACPWPTWEGHQLAAEQLSAIGSVDAVLVPVGGVYTVDAAGAKAVCDAIGARCVIPMHYHHAPYGLPNVAGVEDFLALWPADAVCRLSGPSFEVTAETTGVLVPAFLA